MEEPPAPAPIIIEETDIELPDLLTDLQDKTQLTRRSLVRIVSDSGRLDDFKRNPQQFIELATESINRTKRLVSHKRSFDWTRKLGRRWCAI